MGVWFGPPGFHLADLALLLEGAGNWQSYGFQAFVLKSFHQLYVLGRISRDREGVVFACNKQQGSSLLTTGRQINT